MKTFYLIRHAKSSWADMSLQDFNRPLNKRGLRDAPFMAKMLAGKGVRPDAIVASPANRAWTTANYFFREMGLQANQIHQKPEIYEAWSKTLLDVVLGLDDNWSTVLIFGHNPAFTELANVFAKEYIPNVPTCGIVKIESSANSWNAITTDNAVVTAFYYPKQYFSN